jgi:hypothetical protein
MLARASAVMFVSVVGTQTRRDVDRIFTFTLLLLLLLTTLTSLTARLATLLLLHLLQARTPNLPNAKSERGPLDQNTPPIVSTYLFEIVVTHGFNCLCDFLSLSRRKVPRAFCLITETQPLAAADDYPAKS